MTQRMTMAKMWRCHRNILDLDPVVCVCGIDSPQFYWQCWGKFGWNRGTTLMQDLSYFFNNLSNTWGSFQALIPSQTKSHWICFLILRAFNKSVKVYIRMFDLIWVELQRFFKKKIMKKNWTVAGEKKKLSRCQTGQKARNPSSWVARLHCTVFQICKFSLKFDKKAWRAGIDLPNLMDSTLFWFLLYVMAVVGYLRFWPKGPYLHTCLWVPLRQLPAC